MVFCSLPTFFKSLNASLYFQFQMGTNIEQILIKTALILQILINLLDHFLLLNDMYFILLPSHCFPFLGQDSGIRMGCLESSVITQLSLKSYFQQIVLPDWEFLEMQSQDFYSIISFTSVL